MIFGNMIKNLEDRGFEVRFYHSCVAGYTEVRITKDDISVKNSICNDSMDNPYCLGIFLSELIDTWRHDRYGSRSIIDYSKMVNLVQEPNRIRVDLSNHIEKVIFNDPATIVIWKDGDKTVVQCGEMDIYDPEKGLAMCFAKKLLGNQGSYYNIFSKWLPKEDECDNISSSVTFEATCDSLDLLKGAATKFYCEFKKGDKHDG